MPGNVRNSALKLPSGENVSGGFPVSPFIQRAMFPTRDQGTIDNPVIFSGAGLGQLIQRVNELLLAQVGLVTEGFELLSKFFEIHRAAIP